jgi:hypothetical protein
MPADQSIFLSETEGKTAHKLVGLIQAFACFLYFYAEKKHKVNKERRLYKLR